MVPKMSDQTILLLLHTEQDGHLTANAREALQAAEFLRRGIPGSGLCVGLVGENLQSAADSIAHSGATKYFGVTGPEFACSRYASDAAAIETICKAAQPGMVIAPATPRWNRVLAGAAQRLGGCVDTHITAMSFQGEELAVMRWYYRQRLEGVLTRSQRPWFMSIEPGTELRGEQGASAA